jgi:hypothetical protein
MTVSDVTLDEAGNCRSATIGMLDRAFGRLAWRRWHVGQKAHFHPFKVGLLDTRRAGLHLVSEWRRDLEGELKFAGAHPIRENDVFVIDPSSVTTLAEPFDQVILDPIEARYVRSNLCDRFGMDTVLPPSHVHRLEWFTDMEEAELAKAEGGPYP